MNEVEVNDANAATSGGWLSCLTGIEYRVIRAINAFRLVSNSIQRLESDAMKILAGRGVWRERPRYDRRLRRRGRRFLE